MIPPNLKYIPSGLIPYIKKRKRKIRINLRNAFFSSMCLSLMKEPSMYKASGSPRSWLLGCHCDWPGWHVNARSRPKRLQASRPTINKCFSQTPYKLGNHREGCPHLSRYVIDDILRDQCAPGGHGM